MEKYVILRREDFQRGRFYQRRKERRGGYNSRDRYGSARTCVIENMPNITDVRLLLSMLKDMGADARVFSSRYRESELFEYK